MAGTASLVQGIGSFGAAYSQSQALRMQGQYQQQQYELNSKLATMQANDAIFQGDVAAKNYGKKVNQLVGSQRAAFGASGVDVNSGSAAMTQNNTQENGAMDILTIKNNAWRTALGYKLSANSLSGQGAMAGIGSNLAASQTLLTGGINALSGGFQAGYYYGGGTNLGRTGGNNASA